MRYTCIAELEVELRVQDSFIIVHYHGNHIRAEN